MYIAPIAHKPIVAMQPTTRPEIAPRLSWDRDGEAEIVECEGFGWAVEFEVVGFVVFEVLLDLISKNSFTAVDVHDG